MKVIKDNTTKEYTCQKCKSILEVSKKDLHAEYTEYHGIRYYNNYFYCPCCEGINFVD